MDAEMRNVLIQALPVLLSSPPDVTIFLRQLVLLIVAISRPPPEPLLELKYRISDGTSDIWEGRDVFQIFASHHYSFYEVTGETPETL